MPRTQGSSSVYALRPKPRIRGSATTPDCEGCAPHTGTCPTSGRCSWRTRAIGFWPGPQSDRCRPREDVGARTRSSCSESVFVDEASEQVVPLDLMKVWRRERGWGGGRAGGCSRALGAGCGGCSLGCRCRGRTRAGAVDDQHSIEALSKDGADPALHVSVRVRRLYWCADDLDVVARGAVPCRGRPRGRPPDSWLRHQ
jgi:hypothetical protein